MTELKTPAKADNSFEANGKKYLLEAKLSIARKMRCDEYIIELGAGFPISQMFEKLKVAFDKANQNKLADVAVILHNAIGGVKSWKDNQDPVLKICALYINTENEDRRDITDEQIAEKIHDWKEAGIEYGFFLTLVQHLLAPLIASWNSISRSISGVSENENKTESPN